jgi:undecaprenyl pyrophosphate phosphatase UppP
MKFLAVAPNDKNLKVPSFAAHSARGILRDQRTRRRWMFVILLAAVVIVLAGATVLQEWLDPHEHFARFLFYWFVCAWFTVTAVLLAIFDMLAVRAQGRAERRELERQARG